MVSVVGLHVAIKLDVEGKKKKGNDRIKNSIQHFLIALSRNPISKLFKVILLLSRMALNRKKKIGRVGEAKGRKKSKIFLD